MLFPHLIKVSFLFTILTLGYRWLVQFETFSKVNRLLLVVVISVSTAFVAPQKKQLIELTPAASKPATKVDVGTLSAISESKFWVKRNDTLFWAISPLASLDDLEQLKKELKAMGTEFEITDLKFDSQERFISLFSYTIKAAKSISPASGCETPGIDLPINGHTGYVTKERLKITEEIPQDLFVKILKDRQTALNLAKGEAYFTMHKLLRELKEKKIAFRNSSIGLGNGPSLASQIYHGVENAQKEYEKKLSEQNTLSLIGLVENKLELNEIYKNTAYYINTKLTTGDELSKLSISHVKEIHRITEKVNSQKHFFVITK